MKEKKYKEGLTDDDLKAVKAEIARKRIAERIESILVRKGLTHRDLANLLGKQESEISRWMSGKHNFTITTITSIEYALAESILTPPAEPVATIASEPAAVYYTPSTLRDTCIAMLNKTNDADVLNRIRKSMESIIASVSVSKSDGISDFIKSLKVCAPGTVPADVNGSECRIEEKYLK